MRFFGGLSVEETAEALHASPDTVMRDWKLAKAWVAGAMLAAPQVSVASEDGASSSETRTQDAHVRSAVPALKSLIHQATERSATFSQLLETIDASDSYVYVQDGDCGHGVRACFDVSAGGSGRIERVIINMHKTADWDLMGSIGHELRHTIEVISNPSIKSNAAKYFFYEKIGTHGITGAHETRDAVEAANTIRSEVRKFNRRAKSE